jgi:hypothetical protein
MTELNAHFDTPKSRLQILMLFNIYTSTRAFEPSSPTLATHPLMLSIIHSLLLDTSATLCAAGLTLLVKLLPIFAVYARKTLKAMFPSYLAILARVLCWKERVSPRSTDIDSQLRPETEPTPLLPLRPDLQWNRLESTFDTTPSPPPCPRTYFTIMYYLYPSNVLQFLSGPAEYLSQSSVLSPYTVEWKKALDQDEIRRRSEVRGEPQGSSYSLTDFIQRLVLEHVCHPLLIWRDPATELSSDEFWSRYSLSRILSEASMLDARHTAIGILEQIQYTAPPHPDTIDDQEGEAKERPLHLIRPIALTAEKATISLEDMVNTTLALKSGLQVDIIKPVSQWPNVLFSSPPTPEEQPSSAFSQSGDIPHHVVQVISNLQREIVFLRNELNFELWLSRENVKHIGRLYQDRIQAKAAENERQGLVGKILLSRLSKSLTL